MHPNGQSDSKLLHLEFNKSRTAFDFSWIIWKTLSSNSCIRRFDMWDLRHERKEESVEQAALQILNLLYSVPQLSVRFAKVPDEHYNMIRFWLRYWNENRHVLMDVHFIPSNAGSNYPILSVIRDKHQITTIYENIILK